MGGSRFEDRTKYSRKLIFSQASHLRLQNSEKTNISAHMILEKSDFWIFSYHFSG